MVTPTQMRAFALALPDAVELPHFERASFRVGKKIFATLAADRTAMVKVDLDTHEALLAADPAAFFSYGGWSRSGATGVNLDRVPLPLFRDLLEQAWRAIAPRGLVLPEAPPKRPKRSGAKRAPSPGGARSTSRRAKR